MADQGFHTCRFCDGLILDERGVRYGTRHWAHFHCFLDAGKCLADLPRGQVSRFPYFLLKERGLLDKARRLTAAA